MPDFNEMEKQAKIKLFNDNVNYERQIASGFKKTVPALRGELSRIFDEFGVEDDKGVKRLNRAKVLRYSKYAAMEKRMMDLIMPTVNGSINMINRTIPAQRQNAMKRFAYVMDVANGVRLKWNIK